MDIVSLTSRIITKTFSKLVNRSAEKALGFDPCIKLRKLDFLSDKTTTVDIQLEMSNESFEKLLEVLVK